MARRVFFSFHYKNDVWRACVVRNSWVTKERIAQGFTDAAAFEEVQKEGEQAIKNWIKDQLYSTSVTVVLIGSDTSNRKYVRYEIQQSFKRNNGILGINIYKIKNQDGNTSEKGSSNFGIIGQDKDGKDIYFKDKYKIYNWFNDEGYKNLGDWIEEARKDAKG